MGSYTNSRKKRRKMTRYQIGMRLLVISFMIFLAAFSFGIEIWF